MAHIRYSAEALRQLRDSPLVRKPDSLPSIEQWMENGQTDQNQRNKTRPQSSRPEDASYGHDNNQQRPPLYQRHTRTTTGEDIVLGPPKFSFASASASRNPSKLFDPSERLSGAQHEDEMAGDKQNNNRDRFFKDREGERQRDRGGILNGKRNDRREGEGWGSGRQRRDHGQDEDDRGQRNGDREKGGYNRDRIGRDRDADNEQEAPNKRPGLSKSRFESSSWIRGEAAGVSAREDENKDLGRDRRWGDRDRREDRGYNNRDRVEQDPEWMDTPANDDFAQQRTAADFQRWKESMKAGQKTSEEKEAAQEDPVPAAEPAPMKEEVPSSKVQTPAPENLFGMWAGQKKAEVMTPETTMPKATGGKSSRFAGFFAPKEEPPRPAPEPTPLPEPRAPTASPPVQNTEDKEGFQRILAMLGNANISAGSIGKPLASANGPNPMENPFPMMMTSREKPLPPQRQQSMSRSRGESQGFFDGGFSPQPTREDPAALKAFLNSFSPQHEVSQEQLQSQQHTAARRSAFPTGLMQAQREMEDQRMQHVQPHSAHASVPPQISRDKEFLLNLMQQGVHAEQRAHAQRRLPTEVDNFNIFLDTKAPAVSGPKTVGPTSGVPDGGFFAELSNQRRESEISEQMLRRAQAQQGRMPPGLYEDLAIRTQQRRDTGSRPIPMQQQQQNPLDQIWLNPPPQQQQHHLGAQPQQDRIAPPPGFDPQLRSPPGFGIPNLGPPNAPAPPFRSGVPPPRGMVPLPPPNGPFPPQMGGPPPGFFNGPHGPPGFGPPMPFGQDRMIPGMPPMLQERGRPPFEMYGDMGQPQGRGAARGPPF